MSVNGKGNFKSVKHQTIQHTYTCTAARTHLHTHTEHVTSVHGICYFNVVVLYIVPSIYTASFFLNCFNFMTLAVYNCCVLLHRKYRWTSFETMKIWSFSFSHFKIEKFSEIQLKFERFVGFDRNTFFFFWFLFLPSDIFKFVNRMNCVFLPRRRSCWTSFHFTQKSWRSSVRQSKLLPAFMTYAYGCISSPPPPPLPLNRVNMSWSTSTPCFFIPFSI